MSEYPERLRRFCWRVREFLWFLWRVHDEVDGKDRRIGWRTAWAVANTAVPTPEQERKDREYARGLMERVEADIARAEAMR